jgi:hypothetical protein
MNDIAVLTTEDAVVRIFSIHGKTFVSSLSEAVEIPPVVPASRFLAKIAPDGSLVSQLRTCHLRSRH